MEEMNEGVNVSEVAPQTEEAEVVEETTEAPAEETTEAEQPELDRNAIYADARRKAEAEARHKYESIDAQFAEEFGKYENPITHQPIRSAKDYFEAMQAQKQLATKKELVSKGIDPKVIEDAVNNSPAMIAANQVLAEERQRKVQSYLEDQIKAVSQIDPSIKSVEDIEKSEKYNEVLQYVRDNKLSIVDAYKLVYADKLTQSKTEAVKQQAINNAKSQSHLKATDGGSTSDQLVNIPESQLAQWQAFYPEKTNKELRELYNKYLHKN